MIDFFFTFNRQLVGGVESLYTSWSADAVLHFSYCLFYGSFQPTKKVSQQALRDRSHLFQKRLFLCIMQHFFFFLFYRSFSFRWWFWLSSTGIFMAGAFSIKFVGLFLVFLVGIRAIYDLWIILGDMSRPVVNYLTLMRKKSHNIIYS